MQVIDARDVGRFVRTACERELAGGFNFAGPRLTWTEFLSPLGSSLCGSRPRVLRAAGLTESELPLYRRDGGPRSAIMHVDNARAVRAGLTLTDPRVTAADMRAWLTGADLPAGEHSAQARRGADDGSLSADLARPHFGRRAAGG